MCFIGMTIVTVYCQSIVFTLNIEHSVYIKYRTNVCVCVRACVRACVCLWAHHWFVDPSLFLWQVSIYLAASKIQSCFSPNKYWSCVFLFNILKSGQSVSNLGWNVFLFLHSEGSWWGSVALSPLPHGYSMGRCGSLWAASAVYICPSL